MDNEKVERYYSLLAAFKNELFMRTFYNEEYREAKIYNFWYELDEKLSMIKMFIQKFIVNLLFPLRTPKVTFDRLISRLAFCPPLNTYTFYYEERDNYNQNEQSQSLCCEILLSQFLNNKNAKLVHIYRNKYLKIANYFECFYTYTIYGNRIACIFIKNDHPAPTIVYSHTNAEDIGTILGHMWKLKRKVQCNVFTYDYSGFGMSSGLPSERNIYADIQAAVNELMKRKNIKENELILFGESIGSAPTIFLATQINPLAVILQSSFKSGIRLYFNYGGQTLPFDPFPNIDLVPFISASTLIIHGSEDMLVDISHAMAIFNSLKNPAQPFWVNGASHMNIHKHPQYYDRLNAFIKSLGNPRENQSVKHSISKNRKKKSRISFRKLSKF